MKGYRKKKKKKGRRSWGGLGSIDHLELTNVKFAYKKRESITIIVYFYDCLWMTNLVACPCECEKKGGEGDTNDKY